MNYVILPQPQWQYLEPTFRHFGSKPPSMGVIAAAVDNQHVAGFMVAQPALHVEPLWIDKPYRGKVDFLRLRNKIAEVIPQETEYYVFAPNNKIARMAELGGLSEMNYRVWKGAF